MLALALEKGQCARESHLGGPSQEGDKAHHDRLAVELKLLLHGIRRLLADGIVRGQALRQEVLDTLQLALVHPDVHGPRVAFWH